MRRVFVSNWQSSMAILWRSLLLLFLAVLPVQALAQGARLTVVELNVENLFDTHHDSLKRDEDFLPEGRYRWTPSRYWRKLNRLGQTIIACGTDTTRWELPDLVALCEVENDTVLHDLTRRSLLRRAGYEYVMTDSPDERGIDVALLYSDTLRVAPARERFRPTRDVLHACGQLATGDTLHVFVVHAPSRRGGERASRPYRMAVAHRLSETIDTLSAAHPAARILVLGDFNDYNDAPALRFLASKGLTDVSAEARGTHGARATYRYQGLWSSLDHILVCSRLLPAVRQCVIIDEPFLIEPDEQYGGVKPRRGYYGPRYNNGYSDHLPLVLRLEF